MKFNYKYLSISLFLVAPCLWGTLANAQSYLSPGYIIGEIRDGLGIVKPEPAPDFVVRGRPQDPASLEYTPLKPPPRGFHSQASTPAGKLEGEAKAIAELESARASNQSRAAGGSGAAANPVAKSSAPVEEDPAPMKWKAWDTE